MKMKGMWSPGLMFHSSNHTRRPAVRSRGQLAQPLRQFRKAWICCFSTLRRSKPARGRCCPG
jgi:hypothetical protein